MNLWCWLIRNAIKQTLILVITSNMQHESKTRVHAYQIWCLSMAYYSRQWKLCDCQGIKAYEDVDFRWVSIIDVKAKLISKMVRLDEEVNKWLCNEGLSEVWSSDNLDHRIFVRLKLLVFGWFWSIKSNFEEWRMCSIKSLLNYMVTLIMCDVKILSH